MSVIHFSAEEYANIIKVLGDTYERRKRRAADLAIISKANAACYSYRYGDGGTAATAEEIFTLAGRGAGDLSRAVSTAGLLHYNCQEDKDFLALEEGGLAALVDILTSLLWRVADQKGVRS